MNIHDKNAVICNKEQRRIQNSVKHLIWSFLLKAFNYIHKSFILDVWPGSKYTSEVCKCKTKKIYITVDNFFCIVTHHCTATYGIRLLHMYDINFGHMLSLNIKFYSLSPTQLQNLCAQMYRPTWYS